jgi:hypothetical protein
MVEIRRSARVDAPVVGTKGEHFVRGLHCLHNLPAEADDLDAQTPHQRLLLTLLLKNPSDTES